MFIIKFVKIREIFPNVLYVRNNYESICCVSCEQLVQSRQRLQQRRQSIAASRRGSTAALLPPPPAHLLQAAAAASAAKSTTPRTSSQADVRSSQACTVQWTSPSCRAWECHMFANIFPSLVSFCGVYICSWYFILGNNANCLVRHVLI